MATIKQDRSFVIVTSALFVASFFTLRAVSDGMGWVFTDYLLVSSMISGIVSLVPFMFSGDRSGRIKAVIILLLYFLTLVGVLLFGSTNDRHSSHIGIKGEWHTREGDGRDFSMNFFKEDSVLLVLSSKESRALGYSLKGSRLTLHDEEVVLFDWKVKLSGSTLVVYSNGEELTFFKQ